jgi:hypothetical protein
VLKLLIVLLPKPLLSLYLTLLWLLREVLCPPLPPAASPPGTVSALLQTLTSVGRITLLALYEPQQLPRPFSLTVALLLLFLLLVS